MLPPWIGTFGGDPWRKIRTHVHTAVSWFVRPNPIRVGTSQRGDILVWVLGRAKPFLTLSPNVQDSHTVLVLILE
jgi:hypothetical protein